MSKPSRRAFRCACGETFDADVFRSANETLQPKLKEEIVAGRFNQVRCPHCGRETHADVPFLYHDMNAGRMIWVYPEGSADQSEAIREKLQKTRAIVDGVLPRPTSPDEPDVVFGLDELVRLLDRAPRA